MKRRDTAAVVFLVVYLVLGIVFAVHAVPVGPVPAKPLPAMPAPTKSLPVKPVPAKPLPVKPVPAQSIPVKPVPTQPLPTTPVPVRPLPHWDDGFAKGNASGIQSAVEEV
jgi:hypothetical protein